MYRVSPNQPLPYCLWLRMWCQSTRNCTHSVQWLYWPTTPHEYNPVQKKKEGKTTTRKTITISWPVGREWHGPSVERSVTPFRNGGPCVVSFVFHPSGWVGVGGGKSEGRIGKGGDKNKQASVRRLGQAPLGPSPPSRTIWTSISSVAEFHPNFGYTVDCLSIRMCLPIKRWPILPSFVCRSSKGPL